MISDMVGDRLQVTGDKPKLVTCHLSRVTNGFTLLELLVVISIIAILAAAMIPNFVGFDAEARVTTTKTNLNALRTQVTLFRTKEGRYPESLEELLTTTYKDIGVEQPYLERIPAELISSKGGNATVETLTSADELTGDGGWAYLKPRARVVVDVTEPLSDRWSAYEGQVPSTW